MPAMDMTREEEHKQLTLRTSGVPIPMNAFNSYFPGKFYKSDFKESEHFHPSDSIPHVNLADTELN